MKSVQIKSIKIIKENVTVYNFSVEGDESYVLNGIVSHNCRCSSAPMDANVPESQPNDYSDFDDWLDQKAAE